MKVLFIGLTRIDSISNRGLYTDFLRIARDRGHELTVLTACEKRDWPRKTDYMEDGVRYFHGKTGNVTKNSNFIEKGIATLRLGRQMYRELAAADALDYDMVICATPSITFEYITARIKKRCGARLVLLLKDMWPYDLLFDGVLTRSGWKGMAYRFLEKIAVRLFDEADVIGCMTPANTRFLEKVYNDGRPVEKETLIPNSIEPLDFICDETARNSLREKYDLPKDKLIYVYGGNLGPAQGPKFVIEALSQAVERLENAFFLIVGNGANAETIKDGLSALDNVRCIPALPHDDYEKLVYACDVGLVFLNWNCHNPRVPSRSLQYLQASIPIVSAVDDTTDFGQISEEQGFGLTCCSNDAEGFVNCCRAMQNPETRKEMGAKGRKYLEEEWSAEKTYSIIFE